MSDLTATNCGCNNNCACNSNSCGGMMGGNFIWIILLLSCCGGCGNGSGLLGGGCGNGCGNSCDNNSSCDWLIWILLISCMCGNNNGCC